MKLSAFLLLLVLAIAATFQPVSYGLQVDTEGTHLRHLQDGQQPQQPDEQPQQPDEQPQQPDEQPQQPDEQPEQPEQPEIPVGMTNTAGGDVNANNPGTNEILVGRCFPGGWNWPRCRFGCVPGGWNWPRCRFGGCFPGSWNWPRCRVI